MNNCVTRFLLEELDIRGSVVQMSSVWQQIVAARDYPAPVTEVLGEMCAVSAIIAANLKQVGRLTFQLSGNGAVSLLVIDCAEGLNLRGYARHSLNDSASAELPQLLGDGQLLMSLDMEGTRQPYQSFVPLNGKSVTEIFEHYLAQSEQQPALLFLFANKEQSVGLFLQKLPGADLKDEDGWNRIAHLASTIKAEELFSLDAAALLSRLFTEEVVRVFDPLEVRHDYPADREKIAAMLRSLGQAEIQRIVDEHGEVRIQDDLSNHEYHFTPEQALALFSDQKPTLH